MAYILNIETATKNCSVSLAHKGVTIAVQEIATQGFSHAEKLHVFIESICEQNNLPLSQLQAIAVSKGPGSYTGLRIGVSAAKGLCYALEIPLIAIDTLAILAQQLHIEKGIIVPMLDARRMEVYTAFYTKDYQQMKPVEALVIDESSFGKTSEILHLIGDGIEKLKETLTEEKFIFHDEITYPSAKEMSFLSFEKYKKSDFEDVAYFEPYYLKDFILNR